MSDTARLCPACRHRAPGDLCVRKAPLLNSISGEPFYPTCQSERSEGVHARMSRSLAQCGPDGRYFEAVTS